MAKPVYENVLPVEVVRPGLSGWGALGLLGKPFFQAWVVMLMLGVVAPGWHVGYWKAMAIYVLAAVLFGHDEFYRWTRMRKEIKRGEAR
jgi:hypothetical protein